MKNRQLFLRCLIAQIGLMVLFSMPVFGQFTIAPDNQMVSADAGTCSITLDLTSPIPGPGGVHFPTVTPTGATNAVTVTITGVSVVDGTNTGPDSSPLIIIDSGEGIAVVNVNVSILDDLGTTSFYSFVVEVHDDEDPFFDPDPTVTPLYMDMTVDCLSDVPSAPTINANDLCSGNVVNLTPTDSGTALCTGGSFTRTWTRTDANNNTITHTQTITVTGDNSAPTIDPAFIAANADMNISCADPIPVAADLTDADVTDDCLTTFLDIAPVVVSTQGAGCMGDSYTITRTWTVTDACSGSAMHTQVITISDTEDPVITVPANIAVDCSADATSASTGVATATDNCTAVVDIVITEADAVVAGSCPHESVITRTWTATDICGRMASGTQVITVQDMTNPAFDTAPMDMALDCSTGGPFDPAAEYATWLANAGTAMYSDNCSAVGDIVLTNSGEAYPGCNSSVTVTFTITDECSNSNIATAMFTMTDGTTPVITTGATSPDVECSDNPAGVFATWVANNGDAAAMDVCDSNLDWTNDAPASLPAGNCGVSVTVTFEATDDCGNMAASTGVFSVIDMTDPTIDTPAQDITVECDDATAMSLVDWIAANGNSAASDNCDMTLTVTPAMTASTTGCGATGSETYEFTYEDNCGNTESTSATYTIIDMTSPTFGGGATDKTETCDVVGYANIDTDFAAWVTAQEAALMPMDCSGFTISNDAPATLMPFTCTANELVSQMVTFTVTDDCTNASSAVATYSITDNTPPMIDCSNVADLTLECVDGANYATMIQTWITASETTISGEAGTTDGCSPTITVSNDYDGTAVPALSCDLSAGLTVTFIATDDCGNTASCTKVVYLDDIVAPTITCPMDLTMECVDGADYAGMINTWIATTTATDVCDTNVAITTDWDGSIPALSCDLSVGLVVTFTATDDCDNTDECTATIFLDDTVVPTIDCSGVADLTLECNTASDYPAMIQTWITASSTTIAAASTDACDTDLTVTDDYNGTDIPTLSCDVNSGNITIEFTVEDDCGNSSVCTKEVYLDDTTAPIMDCSGVADLTLECVDGANYPVMINTWITNSLVTIDIASDDVCGGVLTVTDDYNDTDVPTLSCDVSSGNITIEFTVEDACGNISVCTKNVYLDDTTAPTITTVPNVVVACDDSTAPADTGMATAIDACDLTPTVTSSDASTKGTDAAMCDFYDYVITRTWTATDDCMNTSTRSQTITVEDNDAPVVTGTLMDLPEQCEAPTAATTVAALEAMGLAGFDVADNCAVDANLTVAALDVSDMNACPEIITRTYTVTDPCGNTSANIVQMITIDDDVLPVVNTAAMNTTYNCSTATNTANEAFTIWVEAIASAQASDNCTTIDNGGGTLNAATGQIGTSTWYAFMPGTWTVDDVAMTITGTAANFSPTACPADGLITIDFVVIDGCFNAASSSATFDVVDTVDPVFTDCLADITLTTSTDGTGDCANNYTFDAPIATDDCSTMTTCMTNTSTIITGAADPNTLVDDVVLNFAIAGPPAVANGDVDLDIDFDQLDGESGVSGSTEFFFIQGEDGSILGQTEPTSAQCTAPPTTTVTISESDFNIWALDGNITITLVPNNPGAGNEDDGINNICGSSTVTASLAYNCQSAPAGFSVVYSLDGGATTAPVTYPTITETFPSGTTTVLFTATDCAGNTAMCSFDVTVNDDENPTIADCSALAGLPNPYPAPLCMPTDVTLPRPAFVNDNCAVDSFTMMLTSGVDFPLVTFTEHPNIDGFVMDATSMTFTGLIPTYPTGDATIEVHFQGDGDNIGADEEYFEVFGEDGLSLGVTTSTTSVSCGTSLQKVGSVTIPYATLLTWIADGSIDLSVVPVIDDLSNSGNDGDWNNDDFGINPCGTTFTGTETGSVNDGSNSVLAIRLSIPNPTISYCITGATTIAETDFPIDGSDPTVTLNPGLHTIQYKVSDAEGNTGMCSSSLMVGDVSIATPIIDEVINPDCPEDLVKLDDVRDYVAAGDIFNDPTWTWYHDVDGDGLVSATDTIIGTTTEPTISFLALEGSHEYYVFVTDETCTSDAGFETVTTNERPTKPEIFASPNPVCAGDTIGLFIANSAIDWETYIWSGSDGYMYQGDNITGGQFPPIIIAAANASTTNDTLTYILNVTNLAGCVSADTVLVEVRPTPDVPVLLTNSPLCNEGTIELSTVTVCDSYEWVGPAGFTTTTTNATSILSIDATYAAGMWSVICTSSNGCSSESTPMEIIINDPLNVNATNDGPACTGQDIQLSVTNVDNATYLWDGPNSFASTEQNPIVAEAGDYNVTVTNGNGCIGTSMTTIVINIVPTIVGIIDNASVPFACVNGFTDITLTPSLNPSASTESYTYSWTGPNGFTSTSDIATLPNATSADNGSYTLVVTNEAGCASDPLTAVVELSDQPEAPNLMANSTDLCIGETLVLNTQNYTGGIVQYIWYKNGAITNSTNVSSWTINDVDLTDLGAYSVVAYVNGCMSNISVPVPVTVSDVPTKPIISATPNPLCSGEEFTLAIDNDDAAWDTYTWTGTNGYTHDGEFPPVVTSPDNTGTTSQMLTYILTVANTTGCVSADTVMVEVLPLPAQPSLTSNSPICNQGEIVLTTTATCTSYNWIGPDGLSAATTTTSTTTIPMTSLGYAAGMWTVICIDANGCESESVPLEVIINNPITVPPSNDGPSCEGEDVQLFVEGVDNAISYEWTGPNGYTSTNQNPILVSPTTAEAGTYTVTVMDSNGCVGIGSTDIGVGSLPTIDGIVVNFAANACVSGVEDITLTPTVDGGLATGAPYIYSWTGPNNFASTSEVATIPNASSANNGSYILVVTNAAGCMSNAMTTVVDVTDGPIAPTITNNGSICINAPNAALVLSVVQETAVSGATYEWFTAAGVSIGSTGLITNIEITDFVTYPAGTYDFYVVMTSNGCASAPSVPTTAVLNETATVPMISASPNPVCSGDDFGLFIDNNDPNWVSFTWTGSNGYTYGGQFPPAIEGVNNTTAVNQLLTYELTVEDVGGCTAMTSLTVEVLPEIAVPEFTTNSPVCFIEDIELSTDAACAVYIWNGPEGSISSTTSSTFVFSSAPEYAAGIWSLICEDANGCQAESDTKEILIGEEVQITIPPTFTVCEGDDLQINIDVSSNVVSYEWSGGITSIAEDPILTNVTGADEGTYLVKVYDEYGCINPGFAFTTVIVNPRPIITDIVVDPIADSCVGGDSDITLTPTVNGGIDLDNFTYTWTSANGFTSTDSIAVLPDGTSADNGSYVLVVSDANGCQSDPFTVVVDVRNGPASPNLNVTASVLCTGEDLTISTTGYSGTFVEYKWYIDGTLLATTPFPSYTIQNADNTDSGSYSVIVTVDDCTSNESQVIPITVDEMLPQPIVTAPSAVCAGEILQLETDFIVGAEYIWTGPNGFTASVYNPSIFPATLQDAGSYAVQVIVGNCMSALSDSHIVEVDAAPNVPTVLNNSPLCYEEAGAVLVLSIETSSATPGAIYTWYNATTSMLVGASGFSTNFTITDLSTYSAGMHEFYAIASVNGCSSSPSVPTTVILNATPLKPEMVSSATEICAGDEFTLGLANSSSTWTSFAWTGSDGFTYNEQFPPSIIAENNNTSNTDLIYILTVENSSGCVNMDTIKVTIFPSPAVPNLASNSPICANRSIELETSQVCDSYQWIGPNGASSETLDSYNSTTTSAMTTIPFNSAGYAEGIWTVICISANGCSTESEGVEVVINDPITAPPSNDGPSCEGEDIQLSVGTVDNATGYQWVGPIGFSSNSQNPVINNPTTANAGTYIVIVTDANGCTGLGTTVVEVSNKPLITDIVLSHSANECVTGNEDITMTPMVNDGDNLPTDSGAPYTFLWTGENGFVSTDSIAVLPNGTSADNGSYVLVVTNADGCETDAMTVVVDVRNEPSTPTLSVNETALCVGDELVLTTQGYVGDIVGYQWSNGSSILGFTQVPSFTIPNVDVNDSGNYSVVVAVNGCTSNASQVIPVTVNTTPATPTVTGSMAICMGETLQLETQFIDGAEYTWTGPDGFTASVYNPSVNAVTTDNAGDYTVQISIGGCTSTFSAPFNVMVTNAPVSPTLANNGPICINDDAVVLNLSVTAGTATAGASYEWFDAQTNNSVGVSGLSTTISLTDFADYDEGVYEFYVVASVNGCASSTSIPTAVVMNTIPELAANSGDDIVVCDGLSMDLNATAPTTGTGIWTQVTGEGIEIANPNAPNTAITGLTAGETYTFRWTLSNGACGDYDSDEVNVVVSAANQMAEAGDIVAACNAAGVNLDAIAANAGNTGTWIQSPTQAQLGITIVDANDPNTSVTGLVAGNTYQFTWTLSNAACGDFSTDIVEVLVEDNALNAYAGEDFIACGDGDATILAEPVASCTGFWSSPNPELVFADNIAAGTVVMDLEPGSNILVWTVDCGPCGINSDTLVITYETSAVANADVLNVPFRESAEINVLTNDVLPANYTVTIIDEPSYGTISTLGDGTFGYTHTNTDATPDQFTYQVCSTNCPDVCSEVTTVSLIISVDENCMIPTIITPNNDGINDAFIVECLFAAGKYPDNIVTIYNQWGDELFRSAPYANNWEGTYNGEDVPVGTYYYYVDLGDGSEPLIGFLVIER